MIQEQTFSGGYLEVKLAPTPMAMRSAADNKVFPRTPPTLQGQLITVRFELREQAVTEIRAELVLDHASYMQAEEAGYFGLSADARTAAMTDGGFADSAPVHLLLSADMERVGPHRFEGLDLANNANDLEESVVGMPYDHPRNRYVEFETWTFITAQQKASPEAAVIGYDRVPRAGE